MSSVETKMTWTTVEGSATVLGVKPSANMPPAVAEPPPMLRAFGAISVSEAPHFFVPPEEPPPLEEAAKPRPAVKRFPLRRAVCTTIAAGYLLPMGALSIYTALALPASQAAPIAAALVMTGLVGTAALTAFFSHTERFYYRVAKTLVKARSLIREAAVKPPACNEEAVLATSQPGSALQEIEERLASLAADNNIKDQQIDNLTATATTLRDTIQQLYHELADLQTHQTAKDAELVALVQQYKEELATQGAELAARTQEAASFRQQVCDLQYDVKTLLEINQFQDASLDIEGEAAAEGGIAMLPSSPMPASPRFPRVQTHYDASRVLHRVLDGASALGEESLFCEISMPAALQELCRRLDNAGQEAQAALFLFSQESGTLAHITSHIRQLVEWSPDRFIHQFDLLIRQGEGEWKQALKSASPEQSEQCRLLVSSKSDEAVFLDAMVMRIGHGPLAGDLVGVFYGRTDL